MSLFMPFKRWMDENLVVFYHHTVYLCIKVTHSLPGYLAAYIHCFDMNFPWMGLELCDDQAE